MGRGDGRHSRRRAREDAPGAGPGAGGRVLTPRGDRLIGFYGDDYTGSSAVMEVLGFAGVPTVLFLETPDEAALARFADCRAVGIAGIARSQTPAWMDANLPGIFDTLARIGAPVTHYKVCSTFDSAPQIGSIGRAIELGVPRLGGAWHPLLVAAPALGRYQAFGNLFAVAGGAVHRLDRHPTMSRHPVTPMDEADLRRHLARQIAAPMGLVDLVALQGGRADAALAACLDAGERIVSLDAIDEATIAQAGRLIWDHRGERLFAIGSQGVEYALVAHWRRIGLLEPEAEPASAPPVKRIAVVSASCAPVTAAQIAQARRDGFTTFAVDAAAAADPALWARELDRAERDGLAALREGRSVVLHTAEGPDDPAIIRTRAAIAAAGEPAETIHARIGAGLGRLLGRLAAQSGLTRGVIAGGDTSGHAAQALGIGALTALAPLAPGAPLCRLHGSARAGGLAEIVLKGGQMGGPDFFQTVLRGGHAATGEIRRQDA
ncbi:four-carbon acid sugar kinase family protein [Acidiphilium sp.]|uniref:four-carbon acid sugar kinase family protein n=1 Tax=Acidiphilium sp. TaxID=527 RepID=UPI00258B9690|nr:four-carbon acid sugar kinase family protein [Acidiphilium sp.]